MAGNIHQWLVDLDLEKYSDIFSENEITLDDVKDLGEADLSELGLPMGPRKRLLRAIQGLLSRSPELGGRITDSPPERRRITGERRLLTVMFCDLVGSTALSHQLDPEDLRDLINRYEEAVVNAVQPFDAHVAKFLGDGVLVYFGWPLAYEDQAERAVRAGLDVLKAVSDISLPAGNPLQTRIGIASGKVVVGDLEGDTEHDAVEVTGITPNLAARLQSIAEPDQIVIGSLTRKLVGHSFTLEELEPARLKGFEEPVPSWRVTGDASIATRFEASRREILPRFVGHEDELTMMKEAWCQVRKSSGQLVSVSGEAGIGKSRLIQAFRDEIKQTPHFNLLYQCSARHINSAFYPIIQRLKLAAGFVDDDSEHTRLQKLEKMLSRTSKDIERDIPLFASLLSLPYLGEYTPLKISSQRQRDLIMDALTRQLVSLSKLRPVLIVVEDSHWIDPTTEALLNKLTPIIQDLSLYIVISHRPDYKPNWKPATNTGRIKLDRLAPEYCREIANRFGGNTLKPEIIEQIIDRAEGIPLYVEELTRSLLESAPGVSTIPASLQASLIARLDRLKEAKVIAQVGAVIGREFTLEMIQSVLQMGQNTVYLALDLLVQAELVTENHQGNSTSYVFKHALIQNTAYENLLRLKRQQYHGRIADIFIAEYPEKTSTEPLQVAQHLSKAHRPEEATEYWILAGKRAAERSEEREAVSCLEKGLEELNYFKNRHMRDPQELRIRLALGASLLAVHGWSATTVEQNYSTARALSEETGDIYQKVAASHGLANVFFLNGQIQKARRLANQELAIAIAQKDENLLMGGHRSVGMCGFFAGDFPFALEHLSRANSLYKRDQHSVQIFSQGTDPFVIGLSVSSWTNWILGDRVKARTQMKAALSFAKELNHPFSVAYAKCLTSSVCQTSQDFQMAHRLASEAKIIATEFNYPYWLGWASILQGWSAAALGDSKLGLSGLREGKKIYESTGARQIKPYILTLEAEIQGWSGWPDQGIELLEHARVGNNETDVSFYEVETLRLLSELSLQTGAGDSASYSQEALVIARRQKALGLGLRAAISAARSGAVSNDIVTNLVAELNLQFSADLKAEDFIAPR